jgi:nitrite reductase/ring-hydroxylating ferredoxin subunit
VVATNSPVNNRLLLQTKQAQYRTYVIGISLPKGEIEEGLYWDVEDPYHYIRLVHSPKEDRDYVLIGGEDHKTGQKKSPEKAFSNLKKWAARRFSPHEIVYQWSGQIIEPMDQLAFIGRNPGEHHTFVHTGASGSGLTYGTIAGFLIPDLIEGRPSPFEKLYDPRRKTLKAAGRFFKESANMAAQYADWVKPSSFNPKKLSPHEGAVVRRGLILEAVYKDGDNRVHCLSATCPHLGGIVRWNHVEKTWDCPCHGSRFTAEGEVINGPANEGLKRK